MWGRQKNTATFRVPPVSRGGGPRAQVAAAQGLVYPGQNFIAFDQGCLQGRSMIKGHVSGAEGNCLAGQRRGPWGQRGAGLLADTEPGDWVHSPSDALTRMTLATGLYLSGPLLPHL